ncbi:1476_t:CDS:2, partial [Cetraspora pellucida]
IKQRAYTNNAYIQINKIVWYSYSKYYYLSDENSEYNSDSGDDLSNLTRDKQRVLQKYKYLNHSDCSRKECLYVSENVQPEGWVIRQEFPHSYRYFNNLSEFEIWHESIPENQRTFHKVIRIGQSQKIKINMNGELEKFASYFNPLDRIAKALGQKSFDGYIANTYLHTWQKSTDIMSRKFTSRILELLPERMHPFINEKINKDLHCFRLAGSHKAKDSSHIKRICSNHTWRELLITHIEKDSIELWPYEWEEDKKLKNEQKKRESGIEVVRADHNKKKVIPRLDRLRARLQHRSQSHSQNNFTAVGKNIEIYNAKTMHSYNLQAKLMSGNQHLMLIKRHCGVGKSNETAEEIRTLCHSNRSFISTLIISGQYSLAYGQKVLFEGFKFYLELNAKKLNPKDILKLIISLESIHKLGATGYNVIILDEFETITQNFSGPIMKKPKLSHDVYKSLLQSALLILALDATLDSDSLVHLQNISKIDAKNSTNVELIEALRQELKVYILMFASAEMAEALHKELESQGYQGKCFSKRLLETEKKEIFADINNVVANLDYLIATSVMTCRLNQNVVHILTDLHSDNLPTDHKNLLRFISYQCNIAEYPDLEEAYCDKILTPDGRWIFKPNASLETHLYNASHHIASRNDFVSLLTDHLSECGYNINIAEDCPFIDSKLTENNEGKELLLQVLSDIEALNIRECLEREEDINLAYRLALQKYNLASFYKKTSEDITKDFKASCDSLLPKVIALEEILRGIGFSSEKDRRNQLTHLKLKIDRNLKMILPDACLSNNVIADPPKSDLNSSQDICHVVNNTIGEVSTTEKNISKPLISLSSEFLINNESDIDTLILLLQQKFQMLKEKLEQWRTKIAFEMRDNYNYWKKERESMNEIAFLKYK